MTQNTTQEDINYQIKCVSHEIRNHLSICDMYSQIIKKNLEKAGISNPSIDNALECIEKSVQIIGANVLDLKSLNNTAPRILDFETIINKGTELSKAYVTDKEIEFSVFVKNSAKIYADENRLLSCIVNIIKNGIESIEIRGKIEILAQVKNKTAILKIINNGKPIPKDKQKNIFTKGFTTKKNGCGLGLSICKDYLESQNAQLNLVKSTKSLTQFEIRIPTCE